MSLPQAHDEQIPDGRIQKTRGAERWVFAVAVLILLGLLGHVLNQQRATTRTSDTHVASAPMPAPAETMPAPAETKPDATQQRPITHQAERPQVPPRPKQRQPRPKQSLTRLSKARSLTRRSDPKGRG